MKEWGRRIRERAVTGKQRSGSEKDVMPLDLKIERKGPQAKECGWPLGAGKGRGGFKNQT